MIKLLLGMLICSAWPGLPAFAHGPTPQSAEEHIVIDASADAVWAVLKDFGGLASWHPLVATSTVQGGERSVTLRSGGELLDSLDEFTPTQRSYSYRLMRENIDALPVSFYTATVAVKATGAATSEVTWSARFYRGDTRNDPPDNLNDAAAISAMKDFFAAGLRGLKAKLERS